MYNMSNVMTNNIIHFETCYLDPLFEITTSTSIAALETEYCLRSISFIMASIIGLFSMSYSIISRSIAQYRGYQLHLVGIVRPKRFRKSQHKLVQNINTEHTLITIRTPLKSDDTIYTLKQYIKNVYCITNNDILILFSHHIISNDEQRTLSQCGISNNSLLTLAICNTDKCAITPSLHHQTPTETLVETVHENNEIYESESESESESEIEPVEDDDDEKATRLLLDSLRPSTVETEAAAMETVGDSGDKEMMITWGMILIELDDFSELLLSIGMDSSELIEIISNLIDESLEYENQYVDHMTEGQFVLLTPVDIVVETHDAQRDRDSDYFYKQKEDRLHDIAASVLHHLSCEEEQLEFCTGVALQDRVSSDQEWFEIARLSLEEMKAYREFDRQQQQQGSATGTPTANGLKLNVYKAIDMVSATVITWPRLGFDIITQQHDVLVHKMTKCGHEMNAESLYQYALNTYNDSNNIYLKCPHKKEFPQHDTLCDTEWNYIEILDILKSINGNNWMDFAKLELLSSRNCIENECNVQKCPRCYTLHYKSYDESDCALEDIKSVQDIEKQFKFKCALCPDDVIQVEIGIETEKPLVEDQDDEDEEEDIDGDAVNAMFGYCDDDDDDSDDSSEENADALVAIEHMFDDYEDYNVVDKSLNEFCFCCGSEWISDHICSSSFKSDLAEILQIAEAKKIGSVDDVPSIRCCPNCCQLIFHVDACKHMQCRECKTDFCFVCLKPKKDGNWQCGSHSDACAVAKRQNKDTLPNTIVITKQSFKLF